VIFSLGYEENTKLPEISPESVVPSYRPQVQKNKNQGKKRQFHPKEIKKGILVLK